MSTPSTLFFLTVILGVWATNFSESDSSILPEYLAEFVKDTTPTADKAARIGQRAKALFDLAAKAQITPEAIQEVHYYAAKELVVQTSEDFPRDKSISDVIFKNLAENLEFSAQLVFRERAVPQNLDKLKAKTDDEVQKLAKAESKELFGLFYDKVHLRVRKDLMAMMLAPEDKKLFSTKNNPLEGLFDGAAKMYLEEAGQLLTLEYNPSLLVIQPPKQLNLFQRFIAWLKRLFGIQPPKDQEPVVPSKQADPEWIRIMGKKIALYFKIKDNFFRYMFDLHQPIHNLPGLVLYQAKTILAGLPKIDETDPLSLVKSGASLKFDPKIRDRLLDALAWAPELAKYRKGPIDFQNRGPVDLELNELRNLFGVILSSEGKDLESEESKKYWTFHWGLYWDFVGLLADIDQGLAMRVIMSLSQYRMKSLTRKGSEQRKLIAEMIELLPPVSELDNDIWGHSLLMSIVFETGVTFPDQVVPDLGERFRAISRNLGPNMGEYLDTARLTCFPFAHIMLNTQGFNVPSLGDVTKLAIEYLLKNKRGISRFTDDFNELLDKSLTDMTLPQAFRDDYIALKILLSWSHKTKIGYPLVAIKPAPSQDYYATWSQSLAKMDHNNAMLNLLESAIEGKNPEQIAAMTPEEKIKSAAFGVLGWAKSKNLESTYGPLLSGVALLRIIRI